MVCGHTGRLGGVAAVAAATCGAWKSVAAKGSEIDLQRGWSGGRKSEFIGGEGVLNEGPVVWEIPGDGLKNPPEAETGPKSSVLEFSADRAFSRPVVSMGSEKLR